LAPPNENSNRPASAKVAGHGQRLAGRALARLAWLIFLPLLVAAQTLPTIPLEEEPHHRLLLKNDVLKVYAVDVASHDALALHRHDHDDIAVILGDATTVSTSPGQADLLRISKPGEVRFAPGPRTHSLRNIGQGPYRLVTIELLRKQSGVTSSRLRANRQAAFGEADRDELIVLGGGAAISSASGKGPEQSLPPGEAVWIPRGKMKRTIKNNNDADLSIVVVSVKP
jgi:quercetin dioxygenase-like cupin family protein